MAIRSFVSACRTARLLPLLALGSLATAPAAADETACNARLTHVATRFIDNNNLGGYAVAIAFYDQGTRCFGGFGQIAPGGQAPDRNTIFEIGSVTKVFTASLLAIAVDRGVLSLDDTIGAQLPPQFKARAPVGAVTYRELATHTSGLTRLPDNVDHDKGYPAMYIDYTPADFKAWGNTVEPRPQPAAWLYSNAGYGLLGIAVTKTLAGQGWPMPVYRRLLNETILTPLAMGRTYLPTPDAPRGGPERQQIDGHKKDGGEAAPWPVTPWFAGGALRSTSSNLLRFVEANLGLTTVDGPNGIVTVPPGLTAAFKLAQTPQMRGDGTPIRPGTSKVNYQALGWEGVMTADGQQLKAICKNGGTAGFSAELCFNPDTQRGAVVLVNRNEAPVANPAVLLVTGEDLVN